MTVPELNGNPIVLIKNTSAFPKKARVSGYCFYCFLLLWDSLYTKEKLGKYQYGLALHSVYPHRFFFMDHAAH